MKKQFYFQTRTLVLSVLLFFSSYLHVSADCVLFEPIEHLNDIALVVEGRVIEANNDEGELENCSATDTCLYRARILVSKVLKGSLTENSLTLEYPYWSGCPGVDTYSTGGSYLFFLSSQNSLYGTSCGFGALEAHTEVASKIRQRLKLADVRY